MIPHRRPRTGVPTLASPHRQPGARPTTEFERHHLPTGPEPSGQPCRHLDRRRHRAGAFVTDAASLTQRREREVVRSPTQHHGHPARCRELLWSRVSNPGVSKIALRPTTTWRPSGNVSLTRSIRSAHLPADHSRRTPPAVAGDVPSPPADRRRRGRPSVSTPVSDCARSRRGSVGRIRASRAVVLSLFEPE